VRYCVENLIGQISETQVQNPYETPVPSDESKPIKPYGSPCLSSLTICADEIIHVLDALSQQYNDPILSSSLSAFSSQYPTANNGFKQLRHELLMLQEPGSSSTSGHPCQENWVVLPILEDGRPDRPSPSMVHGNTSLDLAENWSHRLGDIDGAQRAAARLVFEAPVADGVTVLGLSQRASDRKSLVECFDERAKIAFDAADNVDAQYWYAALDLLQERYPTARWGQDDSRVLRPLLQHLRTGDVDSLAHIQPQISRLEDAYSDSKRSLLAASKRLHLLKVRLWYETGVINSNPYEEAKNIARALNYMALSPNVMPESTHSASSDRMRPSTSTSTTSSMFEQTRVDTMNIMKAPIEHGGSRKLADLQVEMTKKWLDRNGIENFCKGEERIHRFCMEIKMATRKLVGETYAESPVLWTSDLWTKEKLGYEIGATAAFSIHGSTRTPSVMSETYSTTNFPARPLLPSLGFSARSFDVDIASSHGRKSSFYSLGSHRLSRDIAGSDYATSFSPGQSLTATSGESVSSLWSPMPSQSRSATSASMPSRTPSISNEVAGPRFSESSVEKTKFLDDLQHDLTTLLLSDLGNPVWCQGSETDTWLVTASRNPNITRRLERQQQISQLLPPRTTTPKQTLKRPKEKRRTWSADTLRRDDCAVAYPNKQEIEAAKVHCLPNELMMGELQDILERISDHIDPRMKLDAVHEFKVLAMQAYPKPQTTRPMQMTRPSNETRPRGSSLGPGSTTQRTPEKEEWRLPESQSEITEYLKTVLLALQHQTLFRDLQYIAAFISADILNKTEKGRAFLHVGLGALACKDEYCRTMVDLADKIVAKDGIKRRLAESDGMEEGLKEAKEYWKLAAREGNCIAQRELASLYLAHPEVLPIISLPMSLSSEVFKTEMRWDERTGENTNTQALCLALHWMQQAAENGDQVALRRLEERKESSSLR
jgi:hypothetical protein